jgi:hypothetical protein
MATDQPSHDSLPVSSSGDGTLAGLTATCHCGQVQVELPSKPEKLTECHCTVCYKYGALWAYFPRPDVTVRASDTKLQVYIREDGEGDIAFNRCGHCGCLVCWWGEGKWSGPEHIMGVNCRMLPENEIEGIERKVSKGP